MKLAYFSGIMEGKSVYCVYVREREMEKVREKEAGLNQEIATFNLKGYQIEREMYYYLDYFLQETALDFILIFCNPEKKLIIIEQK